MVKAEMQWLQRNDLTRLDYDAIGLVSIGLLVQNPTTI